MDLDLVPVSTINHVHCAGIANQRETTIVWDRLSGQPLYPAIVWSDTRTNQILDQIIHRWTSILRSCRAEDPYSFSLLYPDPQYADPDRGGKKFQIKKTEKMQRNW